MVIYLKSSIENDNNNQGYAVSIINHIDLSAHTELVPNDTSLDA